MKRIRWQFAATILALALLAQPDGHAQKTMAPMVLKGMVSIEDDRGMVPVAYRPAPRVTRASGKVTRQGSAGGLGGVTVTVPQIGYTGETAPDGSFQLPELPAQPLIVGFSKPGYVPQTATLDADWQSSGRTLHIALTETRNTLVIDNQIRHLGDNSYSPVSAGAERFRRAAEGPVITRQFVTPPASGPMVYLEIGSVIGLDTEAAHRLGQSAFHRTSTPMLVKVNGELLTHITANGDGQRVAIPRALLRDGMLNTLEIRTGYQSPDGISVDFDDIELMLLTLQF